MTGQRMAALFLLLAAALGAADPGGKWDIVWNTPGGERRSTMTITMDGENVKAELAGGREPIPGKFKDGELILSGKLYSAEAGSDGVFKMQGKLEGEGTLKGSASWDEHQMTFVATRAK